jgi:hypothetical protein
MVQLHKIDDRQLSDEEKNLKARYVERFELLRAEVLKSGESLIDDLHAAYIEYWLKVMLQELSLEAGYRFLYNRLTPLARHVDTPPGPYSLAELERLLLFFQDELSKRGFHTNLGRVSPHLTFMVWREQEEMVYTVDLGDEVREVPVVMMDKFISFGWGAFATFDIMYVGGWARGEKLYCVKPAYDLSGEDFKVGFLAHEARHLSDYKKYPWLSQTELEYRAKLTELHLAQATLPAVIDKLLGERKDNPALPHPYAAYQVVRDLAKKMNVSAEQLNLASPKRTRTAAGLLIDENNRKLETSLQFALPRRDE